MDLPPIPSRLFGAAKSHLVLENDDTRSYKRPCGVPQQP